MKEYFYFKLDDWQERLLEIKKGNIIVLGGRQIGKSEIFAAYQAMYLLQNPNSHLLIVSGVERQASGLYNKIISYLERIDPKQLVKKGKKKVLNTVAHLKNGSILRTEPVGEAGAGARQHTLTRVVFEEMQLIPEAAFSAITPMLLTTGGDIQMIGTAWATEGYVYERLRDPDFQVFRIDAEDVAEKRPEPQRTIMLNWLEKERSRLTTAEYMREYKAIPSDKLRQIFPDELIKKVQVLEREEKSLYQKCAFGVDPAALGEDEGAISVVELLNNEKLIQLAFEITKNTLSNELVDKILRMDQKYKSKKIFIDDGGVGFGVFSGLMNDPRSKNKTVALNNAQRSIDGSDEKRKRILKEDLYMNLLYLMETGKIKLLKDPEIRESLKSCKFDYDNKTKKLKITSTYNHPVESLTRAAWIYKEKTLNLYATYTKHGKTGF